EANAPVPIGRNPPRFIVSVDRQSPTELTLSASTPDRPTPLRLQVRHAETGAPDGPNLLAEHASGVDLNEQPFTHILLHNLSVGDLTGAFEGTGRIQYDAEMSAELVMSKSRQGADGLEHVAVLLDLGPGYLVASGREATIVERASIPMIYTRERGQIDILAAELRFPHTGGVFSGAIVPTQRGAEGSTGLAVQFGAPRYGLSVPPSQALERARQSVNGQIALSAYLPDDASWLQLDGAQIRQGDATVALMGFVDLASGGPQVSLEARSTPMSAPQLASVWPLPLSPSARNWFFNSVSEARLGAGTFRFDADLSAIEVRDSRALLDDDVMRLSVPYENLVLRTVGDLPQVFGLDGELTVTGRTVTMTGAGGVARLARDEMVAVGPVEFHIPDHAVRRPDASLDLTMAGPAGAFVRMASIDPVNLDAELLPFAPEDVTGRVAMTTRIETVLRDEIDRDAVNVEMEALVEGLDVAQPLEGRALTDGEFRLTGTNDGIEIDGTARLDGVPTELSFTTGGAANLQIAMRLEEAERESLGLNFGEYLTGPVTVSLGSTDDPDTRVMDVDLTESQLSIPEIGWSKPAGRPARASFTVRERGEARSVSDLIVAADGLSARGSLEFLGSELRTAQLDSVAIDEVGRFSLALTRNTERMVARLSGESFTLRPELLGSDREAAGDLEIELDLGRLETQDGAQLRNVRLVYAQTADAITAFDLRAAHTDGADVVGTLANDGSAGRIVISSGNAGTFLSFLGLYDRAEGGRATLVLEPGSVGGRVAGQLLLNDYFIVNEPAMERIFPQGSDQRRQASDIVLPGEFETSDRIQIEATNVSFDRTPDRLIIRNAEGWGPSLGGNIEGVIDYAANEVRLDGTYVPFFTINNIFSRIPLLGTALGNRDTEGLLGITFALVGTVDNPELRVNPMSILAPGAIRNIFEYQQGG
ncbi:MAG: hypothetical protein KI785_09130, partial [Devosiaceae bacterium]|nr:hypothetical protein [Devosiaceae bacterium MH13]